jgi:enamine deaminase RidA (YjgF/YER057c/UK114 family)
MQTRCLKSVDRYTLVVLACVGRHARATIGIAALPSAMAVEVEAAF